MSLQPVSYPGLPPRLTRGTLPPEPGQPAHDVNTLDDVVQSLVGLSTGLVNAVKEVGALRWEKVDARASLGRQGVTRGDPGMVTKYGPPRIVEWVIDPNQALPTNFWETGRVEGGVTYPGDYAVAVEPVSV